MSLFPYERWQVEWANDTLIVLMNVGMAAMAQERGWWLAWVMTFVWAAAYYYLYTYLPSQNAAANLPEEDLDRAQLMQMLGGTGGVDPATVRKLEGQVRQLKMRLDSLNEGRSEE